MEVDLIRMLRAKGGWDVKTEGRYLIGRWAGVGPARGIQILLNGFGIRASIEKAPQPYGHRVKADLENPVTVADRYGKRRE